MAEADYTPLLTRGDKMNKAKCPECSIPTVSDHEDLRYEDMLCVNCYHNKVCCANGQEWSGAQNPEHPDTEWVCDTCNLIIEAEGKNRYARLTGMRAQ